MSEKVLALICKRCFKPKKLVVNFQFDDNNEKPMFINDMIINTWCNKCKRNYPHFFTDLEISNSVSILNKCGYTTKYSCQGHPEIDENGKLRAYDTYIDVSGNKPLGIDLYTRLSKIGFNEWHIRNINNNLIGPTIDTSNLLELNILLESTSFSFCYGLGKVMKRASEIDKEDISKEEKLEKMYKYFTTVNNKLFRVLNKYAYDQYEKMKELIQNGG